MLLNTLRCPHRRASHSRESQQGPGWETLFQGVRSTFVLPLDCKEIQPVHSKGDQPWVFFGRTDTKAETPILWLPHAKSWLIGKDWCWEGLGAGGKGDDRGWDGWMASRTGWTWVWVNSQSWWWTGRPGVLQFIGSQRVGHDWVAELNWTEVLCKRWLLLLTTGKLPAFSLTSNSWLLIPSPGSETAKTSLPGPRAGPTLAWLCLSLRSGSS